MCGYKLREEPKLTVRYESHEERIESGHVDRVNYLDVLG